MGYPYRAEIISLKSPENIELFFVDYGDTQVTHIDDVFELPADKEFSSWPRIAFPIKFNVDFNDTQLAKIEEFADQDFNDNHVIEVKILSGPFPNCCLIDGAVQVDTSRSANQRAQFGILSQNWRMV